MRQHKLFFFKDEQRLYRWRLVAANGKIVATSGENYTSLAKCKTGYESAKNGFANHKIEIA